MAVGTAAAFIDSLAGLAAAELELLGSAGQAVGGEGRIGRAAGRLCPADASGCPCGSMIGS